MAKFYITHLYPKEMSIYGDWGNILTLQYRLRVMGVETVYQTVNLGEPLPPETDFYFIGGGQDNEQYLIFTDLLTKKAKLIADIANGVGLLAICGGYQLLGKSFLTGDGREIPGIGLFPVVTKAPDTSVKSRCIGNLLSQCLLPELKDYWLIGFENHSGQTYFDPEISVESLEQSVSQLAASGIASELELESKLKSLNSTAKPLAKVVFGYGNNSQQKLEGCVVNWAIGTYMHGPCLAKNPKLADWFIEPVLRRKDLNVQQSVDDAIVNALREQLVHRFI